VLDQDLGRVAVLVEEAGVGQESEEGPRLCQHLVELVDFDDDLGRVELEVDLVQVGTGPAGEVAVEVGPLVVEGGLGRLGVHFEALVGGPRAEPLLQGRVGLVVVVLVFGFGVEISYGVMSCHRAIMVAPQRAG
jgi:hypothetical protein